MLGSKPSSKTAAGLSGIFKTSVQWHIQVKYDVCVGLLVPGSHTTAFGCTAFAANSSSGHMSRSLECTTCRSSVPRWELPKNRGRNVDPKH